MTKQLNTDQLDRLAEIKEEILVLLSEALDLVRGTPEEQRANHWFATFCTALDKDNTQGSDSTITMQETIDALKERCRRLVLVASASVGALFHHSFMEYRPNDAFRRRGLLRKFPGGLKYATPMASRSRLFKNRAQRRVSMVIYNVTRSKLD